MNIGLLLHPERGVESVLAEARAADAQGFDSIWLGDHLMSGIASWAKPDDPNGPLDSMMLMAALAAVTSRTRLAWSVLNPGFRYPAMLAKSLASLDVISNGRVICSLGAGSYEPEYSAYGIPVSPHDERVAYLREVVMLLQQLWTRPAPQRTTFEGTHVAVRDLPFSPQPVQRPHPPIWIGGESEGTLAIVRDLADGWVTFTRSPAKRRDGPAFDSRYRIAEATAHPDWPKREMTIVLQIMIFVAETREAAEAGARATLGADYGALDDTMNREIVGAPEDCLARIREIEATGVNLMRATFATPAQQEAVARLLLPLL